MQSKKLNNRVGLGCPPYHLLCHSTTIFFFILHAITSQAYVPSDRDSLLAFKSMISDRSNALESWNVTNTTLHFCQWRGVTCGGRHPNRVTSLILSSLNLTATSLPPHIADLTFLNTLRLDINSFRGSIPHELGRLTRLKLLNLSYNYFNGEIPGSLKHCSKLQFLGFLSNELSGQIPGDISFLTRLSRLTIAMNKLVGTIPQSLGKLSRLRLLNLGSNQLSGNIPSSLYNLSSLVTLVLSDNHLMGTLPQNMFNALPMLQNVILYKNQLQGPIPLSLSNGTNIVVLDMGVNNFSGIIPPNLGNLQQLYWLNLPNNQLETEEDSDWDFVTSLTNCSQLYRLDIQGNNLGGIMPPSLANLSSTISHLNMGSNHFEGEIPEGIGKLYDLSVLALNDNHLTCSIPTTIGKLKHLNILDLTGNHLTGEIPETIGNLTQLNQLNLNGNGLNGSIPKSFAKLQSLQKLDLSENMLTGAIPKELVMLSSLAIYLDLSYNLLSGPLPSDISKLTNLNGLNISYNKLYGEIPKTIASCTSLEYLYMGHNSFNGSIPQSLGELKGLREIDLSVNNLSGNIPEFMANLGGLQYLNLSYNNLQGEVPEKGTFKSMSLFSILGNENLCGGSPTLHLPDCNSQSLKKHHKSLEHKAILILLLGTCSSLFLLLVIVYVGRRLRNLHKSPPSASLIEGKFRKISFAELLKATDGFSPSNLIGSGSHGSVYKGNLDLDESLSVAVKVLNLLQRGAFKNFMAECIILRNVRHRNLLKIITTCSSVDYNGNDFKALVLEFMPNGSLEQWLHPVLSEDSRQRTLNLDERLNIAIDVAFALEYLHHHGERPIVHCDLKPSNILLDADMCAHVGDFGLAKIICENLPRSGEHVTASTGIKGTIGYVAPEYGMGGQASTCGDVYSYGILLLEMFIGIRPTNQMFMDGLTLHNYAKSAFPKDLTKIVDSSLHLFAEVQETCNPNQNENVVGKYRCMSKLIEIGLSCSKHDPKERMKMHDITKEMNSLRDVICRAK